MLVGTDHTTINKMNIPIEVALGIRLLLKRCEQLLQKSNSAPVGSTSNYCGVGDKIMPTPRTIS